MKRLPCQDWGKLRIMVSSVYIRSSPSHRVWQGIFGIRDLTKIRCGNRENDKYIDGIRDLTVPREAGLAKNWARDAGFMFECLSGMPETFKNTRKFKISIERINLHLTFISFCRN